MGTRSNIGILERDGRVLMTYCHWDGQLDYVGKFLYLNYSNEKAVRSLISLGGFSSLYPTFEETAADAYGEPESIYEYDDLTAAVRDAEGFLYLWSIDKECWLVSVDNKNLEPLKQLLVLKQIA